MSRGYPDDETEAIFRTIDAVSALSGFHRLVSFSERERTWFTPWWAIANGCYYCPVAFVETR